ncbi:MAG: hypothetical protein ACYC5X_15760 [Syntrophales bacterium]
MSTVLIQRMIFILMITVTGSSFWGCTFARQAVAVWRSTDHFATHKNDARVLFEPGAEDYANKVALFLPAAILQVEEKQYRSFAKPVRVYICASRDSFARMYGADVRAGVLTKLFLSPRIFEEGDEIARLYLIHELSHLHIRDQLGNYKMSRLPFWFTEGLATYVSNGGGAHTVTEEQAIDSIKSGKYFVPNERGGFIFKKTPGDFGLQPHMFYRQSMTFISYLAATNESGYRKLILGIENRERFSTALQEAYNKKLEELWDDFLHEVNKRG